MPAGRQVSDAQIKEVRRNLHEGASLKRSAMKADMDRKTARKYRDLGQLPSEARPVHDWRTRADPLLEIWPRLEAMLVLEPSLQAKTLLDWLEREQPDQEWQCHRRTLERRVRRWKAEHGPAKEVFFSQVHEPGRLGSSDFTHLDSLDVTIQGQPFPHLLYHFVLTYSNWEHVSLCFSESFASLSEGWQNAVWELGAVPERHRTDRMTLAVNHDGGAEQYTAKYQALLRHYGVTAEATNPASGNENGDCEQSHRRLKEALEQALLLRGSRDFASREEYFEFVRVLVARRNAGRGTKFHEEVARLRALPQRRLETLERLRVRVRQGATIQVKKNTYSVPSRLIGEWVDARIGAEEIAVWYGDTLVQTMERLRGQSKHRIDYRHVIDWLVRKPGAFARYVYREDLYPTLIFRRAYDALLAQQPERADREYVRVLHLAAQQGEARVQEALAKLLDQQRPLSEQAVRLLLGSATPLAVAAQVSVATVDLRIYDALLEGAACLGSERDLPGQEPSARSEAAAVQESSRQVSDMHMSRKETGARSADARREGAAVQQVSCDLSDIDMSLREADLCREDAVLERASCQASDIGMSLKEPSKELADEQGRNGGADALPARTTLGDRAEPVRGGGSSGNGGVVELCGVSAGTARARVPATATAPDRASLEGVAAVAGEELGHAGPQTSTAESGPATARPAEWGLSGPARECPGVWSAGVGEVTRSERGGAGAGARGSPAAVHQVQSAGAGTAEGEARLGAAGFAQATVALGGSSDRRPGLRAAEPRGDGSPVHAAGGTLRARQRAGDQQPGLLALGADLQGPDDDGSGDRPVGASQRDPGNECAELSRRVREADARGDSTAGGVNGGGERRPAWGPGCATVAVAALRLPPLRQGPTQARFAWCVWGILQGPTPGKVCLVRVGNPNCR